jgi:hypothetical protein
MVRCDYNTFSTTQSTFTLYGALKKVKSVANKVDTAGMDVLPSFFKTEISRMLSGAGRLLITSGFSALVQQNLRGGKIYFDQTAGNNFFLSKQGFQFHSTAIYPQVGDILKDRLPAPVINKGFGQTHSDTPPF